MIDENELLRQLDSLRRDVDGIVVPEMSADLISPYLALPALRAFWPMSVVPHVNPQGVDVTANANHLTNNNSADFGYDNLVPYVHFDGANQNLTRADGGVGNWADIRGNEAYVVAADQGFTCYLWAYFDNAAGANEGVLAKGDGTVNTSYLILRTAAGTIRFSIGTGAAAINNNSTVTPAATTWTFVAARFIPSTSTDLWVSANNALNQTTAATPAVATLLDSAFAFALGSYSNNTLYMTGRESLVALCASAHTTQHIYSTFEQTRGAFGV